MSTGFFKIPTPKNEPVKSYVPGSEEREELKACIANMRKEVVDIPMVINGKHITTQNKKAIAPPHDIKHKIGAFAMGDASHVKKAIDAALTAKPNWEEMPWQHRAAIFLKAADLLAGPYRAKMNAATMLGQSKNAFQAEIDSACELIDFFRFNVHYMAQIYSDQPPENAPTIWNRSEYRPLEGFVWAISPFNFTSIGGNLPTSPALMGNTVVWKPAATQIYSARIIMEVLEEAGLPDGVINMIFVSGPTASEVILNHADFAGIHFTGSSATFNLLWKTIGNNIANYKTYPRIVGETGGKDFIVAHASANAKAVATGISRGAFEYQGQKCSAASRAYIADNIWPDVKKHLLADLQSFKMGGPEDFSNFINAVISEKAFDKITSYIEQAKKDSGVEVLAGGNFDKSKGYFIEPTVLLVNDPKYTTMCEEIFGPVITIYVYPAKEWSKILEVVNTTSPYALTGGIFAIDRNAIVEGEKKLTHAAGNFYINDKPTGAVVGQQPFGGARASGTNDKAGSYLNLLRWTSARSIKETFLPAEDYRYPFLGE